jgi:spore germination cell wall hydrolase CwlJ-like protein
LAQPDVRQEVECLARTIYFEARGEPDLGKIAVGHVVMNRAAHPLFPAAVCAVVRQGGEKLRNRCQFSWWCDGRSDQPTEWRAWEQSQALARRIYWEPAEDPTGGALWYHSEKVTPSWRRALAPGPKIGRHVFYRSPEPVRNKIVPLRRSVHFLF